MERLDMIEKIRERADVSYEEAREALEQANDDLLEAIVILEKQGKIREPQAQAEDAAGNGNRTEGKAKRAKSALAEGIRNAWNFLRSTAFHVTHKDKEIFVMPSLVLALIVLCFFYTIIPVMLIAMFFNVRYHFTGSEEADKANNVLQRAGDLADNVKNSSETEAV